jgi:class 3 adenylate cyclase/tetratricopeptide (TPR) repeat protein
MSVASRSRRAQGILLSVNTIREGSATALSPPSGVFTPYVPGPALVWARELGSDHQPQWRVLEGSMVFGDVSGFTKMSERLARHGKVGAEEVTDAINTCFEQLLDVAYRAGGSLLKFGGDALLLYFSGDDHARRAAHAAAAMRSRLRQVGRLRTTAGLVTLRISIGVHSGTFHAFLVGDSHREFLITGSGASATVRAEGAASAGEIVISAGAAAELPASYRGPARAEGYLLRGAPPLHSALAVRKADDTGVDVADFVPVAIRQHLTSGAMDPEHRRASVAFIHFDGTDEIIDHQGPEELARRLDQLVRVAQHAADEFNVTFLGTDIDLDGGKIILVSGVPRRLGEDEDRLVTALRRVVESGPAIPVRIGVHSGPVFAADVGPPYRRTFTVMGDTVNLAARVMAKASPGQVLATPDVLERCRRRYRTTALEPFLVKGKRAPVTAMEVGPPQRVDISGGHLLGLVGRQDEMAVLDGELEHVVTSSSARIVEIIGRAGMGKSRLAEELRTRAHHVSAITIACEEYDRDTPYAPFRLLGLHLLGLDDETPSSVIIDRLQAKVNDAAPALSPSLPLVGSTLGVDIADTPETAGLEPEFRRARIHQSTAEFLSRALPEPCLLCFEDVHHMDEASQELLRAVVDAHGDHSMLVVLTRRTGESTSSIVDKEDLTTVHLGPLPDEAAIEALVGATEEAPLLPHELRALAARASGNPLFLESLLRARLDGADIDDLPATVDAVVNTKLDGLPPYQRHLLRCAAVLGLVFTVRELSDIIDDGDDPLDVEVFRDLGEFVSMDADVLRFRWTIVRDCAYEALPFRRRRDLHGRAAAALVARHGDDIDSKSELLSMHFFHAGAFERAWHFACAAGKRASDRYANVEAAAMFERALAASRRIPAAIGAVEVADAWEALGDVRVRAGLYDTASRAFGDARRLTAGSPLAQARLFLKQAWMPERVGRHSEAIRWIRRGLKELDGIDGVEAGQRRAELLAWCAAVRQAQGRHREAVSWCESAIDEARQAGSPAAEAHALFILDWAWVCLDRWDRVTNSRRALQLYTDLGDMGGQAVVLNNLGGFAYVHGHWDEAIAYYEQGRAARLVTGNDVDGASGTCNIGEVLADQGRYEEAEATVNDALRVWRAARYRHGIGFAHLLLGRVAARTGRFDEAASHFATARHEFAGAQLGGEVRMVDGSVVESLVLQGHADDALALASQLLGGDDAATADTETGTLGPPLERLRGYALMQLGRNDAAHAAMLAALEAAHRQQSDYEIALALVALARLARATGDLAAADRLHDDASGPLERLHVVTVPDCPRVARSTLIPASPLAPRS